MLLKKIKFILIIFLLYQTPLLSQSTSLKDFNSKNLSKYFSGIVAFENKDNSLALEFFNSSKILIDKHDPYLKRYIFSLVLSWFSKLLLLLIILNLSIVLLLKTKSGSIEFTNS